MKKLFKTLVFTFICIISLFVCLNVSADTIKTVEVGESSYYQGDLVETNSLEGNLQLGIHFYARNETDSSNYYLNKTIALADSLLVSSNPEERTEAIVRKVASHMLLEENNIARNFISNQIQIEKSIKVRQTLAYIDDNFDSIEQELYDMIFEIGYSYGIVQP